MDLEAFCEEYGLKVPDNPIKFAMRPAAPEEAGIFYALSCEKDEELGAIGHVRIDFGYEGQEFWHTWWPRGPENLNTPEFKAEPDCGDKRLGVTKDDIASVDLVISKDGQEWISEDYRKEDSFAQDPVVAEAVGLIRQALEEQTQEQGVGFAMGGIS